MKQKAGNLKMETIKSSSQQLQASIIASVFLLLILTFAVNDFRCVFLWRKYYYKSFSTIIHFCFQDNNTAVILKGRKIQFRKCKINFEKWIWKVSFWYSISSWSTLVLQSYLTSHFSFIYCELILLRSIEKSAIKFIFECHWDSLNLKTVF